MLLHRQLQGRTHLLHHYLRRYLSQSSAALALPHEPEAPLTYLPGFPKPETCETITAIPRSEAGKKICAKERKAGRIPSIVFEQEDGQHGGNKRLISVQTKEIKKFVTHLNPPFFLSRLFNLQVKSDFDSDHVIEDVRVLPRLLHMRAATEAILNITFIRAPPGALLKIDVPIVFRGEDVSPGLRKGAYLNIIKRSVKYLCPVEIIPPYIDVDLSELDAGQKVATGDLKVHPALKLIPSKYEPVVKILGAKVYDKTKSK